MKRASKPSRQFKALVEDPLTPAKILELDLRIRAAKKWHQRDVARQMRISHTYLGMLESGERPISENVADKFAELERWFTGEITERGVIIIADFDVPPRIHLFANGRWNVDKETQ